MSKTRKVVISPGFGSGWSTWSTKPQEVAEYQPMVEFLENGGTTGELSKDHPVIVQMAEDLDVSPYIGSNVDRLVVVEVTPPYRVMEYDGSESILDASDLWS